MKRDYDVTTEGVEGLGLRPRCFACLGALTLHTAEISGKGAAIQTCLGKTLFLMALESLPLVMYSSALPYDLIHNQISEIQTIQWIFMINFFNKTILQNM